MTFPSRPQIDYERAELRDPAWEAACFTYLRFIFDRAPPNYIREAAEQVLRYSPMFGTVRQVLH